MLLTLLIGFVLLSVTREQLFLAGTRQAYLSSKSNAARLSSRVVLFLFAPSEALREDRLHDTFGSEAQQSWIVSDRSKLEKLVGQRNDIVLTLEAAEVDLSRKANNRKIERPQGHENGSNPEGGDPYYSKVPYQSRPKHKLTPVLGTKVDSIDWARKALPDRQSKIEKHREVSETPVKPKSSAVFVAYSSPAAAQRAYNDVKFHPVISTITLDRFIGVQPKEALWSNLSLAPPSRLSRASLATALVIATILFWAIPIGFVGAISNIKYLTDKVKFLRFLNNLPPSIIGLISGFLPPLIISTFVSYVPKIFRCGCTLDPQLCHLADMS
jgi:calcium permeable stress-gated cation channel